jgi:hypothetical protein
MGVLNGIRDSEWPQLMSGEFIIVAYDEVDEDAIRPVTAYEVPEP